MLLPKSVRWLLGIFLALAGAAYGVEKIDLSKLPELASRTVDFAADIQPLLESHCLKCHGPEKQKGGWRADVKDSALKGGDDHAPNIVPGRSAESPLIHFVAGLDEDMIMPKKGDRLTGEQIGLLRAWIDQGAIWPEKAGTARVDPLDWWSLKPLQLPPVPEDSAFRGQNPIDAFIHAKLAENHLLSSPEADRRTLIRRLYFDLIGLPPQPEDIDAFVADPDSLAYEKLVDRLLASPQYGERWARHWLDVVRYGETHGYDKDKPRNHAWPYRDYVIRAFSEDKPYGRFVQEQIAGDALFPYTRDGIEALGFISAGPWDLIGHQEVPETKTDGKIARNLDRDDMVSNTMNTFCSTTVQCARCHNHKFDKFITQENYYSLQAVFAALDRDDRKYDFDPVVAQRRTELEARRLRLTAARDEMRKTAIAAAGEPLAAVDKRIADLKKPQPGQSSKADAYGYHSQIAPTADVEKWVQIDLGKSMALSKIVLHPCQDSFNGIGEGFGFPVRFKVELSDSADFQFAVSAISDQTQSDLPNPRLQALSFPVNGQTARYIRITATKLALRKNDYIFALAELEAFDVTEKNVATGATVTALDSIEASPRWRKINLVDGYYPGANRAGEPDDLARLTAERERMIMEAMGEQRAAFTQTVQSLAAVEKEIGQLPPPKVVYAGTIHYGTGAFTGTGPMGGKPRVIQVLYRGDVQNPRQVVGPGTLPIIADEPGQFALSTEAPESERRAALAHWITDPRNPLTWRSIVNRVWQYHFGRGLVDSPNDFGRMGQMPTHPELLDWLAADFRDGGQSIKRLQRLIVTSATYRQCSEAPEDARAAAAKTDADNRFLWHMNRRRLEAEAIRDTVLSVSGQLDLTMGGPSFQDFVVEHPEHSPHYEYRLANPEDPATHRRSVYRFIVRSQPQPFMTTLDCADPSMSVEKRNQSLTALQALALLNNQLMVAMTGHFAERLQKDAPTLDGQIERAIRLTLGRQPTAEEARTLAAYARQYGLPNACRVILNLNEFVFVD